MSRQVRGLNHFVGTTTLSWWNRPLAEVTVIPCSVRREFRYLKQILAGNGNVLREVFFIT